MAENDSHITKAHVVFLKNPAVVNVVDNCGNKRWNRSNTMLDT